MDMTGWAALISALTVSLATLIGGARRLLREIHRRAYEQARAKILQDEAKDTIEAKNREIEQLRRQLQSGEWAAKESDQ